MNLCFQLAENLAWESIIDLSVKDYTGHHFAKDEYVIDSCCAFPNDIPTIVQLILNKNSKRKILRVC